MSEVPGDRLDSWKEIAAYLGRSVRTVRRWESEEGLPVHRQMHHALGNVYAFRSELDAWRTADDRKQGPRPAPSPLPRAGRDRDASIAVLPLANLSADPENDYFAGGLTEEIIADLSKIEALRVISRTSSMALERTTLDARAIGRQLGVGYLLEGSVRRSGSQVRISVRLIDATHDSHLWSERYEGELGDVFAIQERLARKIAEALELRLTAGDDERLREHRIEDVRAYECYLQARHQSLRWREDAIDDAVRLLRNGLEIVGENATLLAALGRAHLQYREAGIDFGEGPLREAAECVRRIFDLDPDSPAGLQLSGWISYVRGDVQQAVKELRRALQNRPNDPDTLALLANCLLISGRVAAARPLIDRLLTIDPLTPLTRCLPGWADLLEGKLEAAIDPYRTMFEMDPANPMARLFYVWVLALNGRTDDVARLANGVPAAARNGIAGGLTLFLARAAMGEGAAAKEAISSEIEQAAAASELFSRFLAEGYALAEARTKAIEWLSVAAERGFINYPFLAEHDPFFSRLRNDPRLTTLMETIRRRWEAFEA